MEGKEQKIMKIRNIITTAALASMLCVSCFAGDITVNLDGKNVDFPNQQPVIQDGRTLIPLRGVFDSLGYDITWAGDTKTVTLSKDSELLIIVIGNKTYFHNGVEYDTDVPAQIINGSTMLPLRAIAEAAGLTVAWDGERKTAVLVSENRAQKQRDSYYFEYSQEDEKFLTDFQKISENFENEIAAYNECLEIMEKQGIHSEEDSQRLANAIKAMKTASEKVVGQLMPLECSEKMGRLKSAYIAYVKCCGEHAGVLCDYIDQKISEDEYTQGVNDTVAKMVFAESEYESALKDIAENQ